jgi:hypothetical protein
VTDQQLVLDWARWYVEVRGWAVMLLKTDSPKGKFPPKNCDPCDANHTQPEQKEACDHLLCHGFYSATKDLERFSYMLQALPTGYLAIRTGQASGALILDVEHPSRIKGKRPENEYGVEVLEKWDQLLGWSLPPTLTARSVSGGLHLVYGLPAGVLVKSGGTTAPGVEVTAESGYAAVTCGRNDRAWLDATAEVTQAPTELLDWLPRAKARSSTGRPVAEATVAQPLGEGHRHQTIVGLAGVMRRHPEFSEEAIKAALKVVNKELCKPPHDEATIDKKVEDVCDRYVPDVPPIIESQRQKKEAMDIVRRLFGG